MDNDTCFSSKLDYPPPKYLLSLKTAVKKLQKKIFNTFENLDFKKFLCGAKSRHPLLYALLSDLADSSAAHFITQAPTSNYCLLNNDSWNALMRIRLGFSPCSILSHAKCACSSPSKSVPLTFSHVVNCNKMITHRSIIHNNVRDCLWSMFCSYRIEAKIEPVLEHLNCFRSSRSARGDL
ncbi:hypothetical protein RCL1_003235 [Eukaryota sp. TZLM3-RCL]